MLTDPPDEDGGGRAEGEEESDQPDGCEHEPDDPGDWIPGNVERITGPDSPHDRDGPSDFSYDEDHIADATGNAVVRIEFDYYWKNEITTAWSAWNYGKAGWQGVSIGESAQEDISMQANLSLPSGVADFGVSESASTSMTRSYDIPDTWYGPECMARFQVKLDLLKVKVTRVTDWTSGSMWDSRDVLGDWYVSGSWRIQAFKQTATCEHASPPDDPSDPTDPTDPTDPGDRTGEGEGDVLPGALPSLHRHGFGGRLAGLFAEEGLAFASSSLSADGAEDEFVLLA